MNCGANDGFLIVVFRENDMKILGWERFAGMQKNPFQEQFPGETQHSRYAAADENIMRVEDIHFRSHDHRHAVNKLL